MKRGEGRKKKGEGWREEGEREGFVVNHLEIKSWTDLDGAQM